MLTSFQTSEGLRVYKDLVAAKKEATEIKLRAVVPQ
jgi:hypothetical protein